MVWVGYLSHLFSESTSVYGALEALVTMRYINLRFTLYCITMLGKYWLKLAVASKFKLVVNQVRIGLRTEVHLYTDCRSRSVPFTELISTSDEPCTTLASPHLLIGSVPLPFPSIVYSIACC